MQYLVFYECIGSSSYCVLDESGLFNLIECKTVNIRKIYKLQEVDKSVVLDSFKKQQFEKQKEKDRKVFDDIRNKYGW